MGKLKKNPIIIFFAVLAITLYAVYQWLKVPEGVEPMGDSSEMIAVLALITAIVSLLTSLVGLIQKLIDIQHEKRND